MNQGFRALVEECCKSAAYHEAGHTVIAALLGLPLRNAGVRVDSKCHGLACLCCRVPGDLSNDARDVDERERTIVMLYAGYVAQRMFFTDCPSDGAVRDEALAQQLLSEMHPLSDSHAYDQRLREKAQRSVKSHWNVVGALAETLWARPYRARVDLGAENGWSDDSKERYMSGHEVRDLLARLQVKIEIV